ncbi:alpha/beta-hydrolase [Neoconidiobolus thromboides FSU 785]|nr:alpha/beta-hydrolase [Neoconidiobolus thromboides FSU 785]
MEYQNYASIAYCKLQQIEEWTCDSCNTNQPAKLISTHKSRRYGTFGMIHVTTNNKILLSFRGTDNLSNKLLDLNIRKRRMKVVDPNYNQDYLNNIKVHSGILSSTDSIIYDMIEQLRLRFNNELDQYTFVLIGHSLGGAMASLASIRLQNELKLSYNSIHLYSYGQPRVGNEEFVKYFNHLPLTAMRIVSQNDIVPHLPLNKMGYYHFNNEYFIHDKKAQFCLPPTNTPPYIIDGKQSYYFEHPECTKKFGYKFGFKWHKFYSEKSIICDGYYIKRRRKKWTKKFKSLQQ